MRQLYKQVQRAGVCSVKQEGVGQTALGTSRQKPSAPFRVAHGYQVWSTGRGKGLTEYTGFRPGNLSLTWRAWSLSRYIEGSGAGPSSVTMYMSCRCGAALVT